MTNMKNIITSHNKAVLNRKHSHTPQTSKTCNCRVKETCPLNGQCLTECVVYRATVTQSLTHKKDMYIGMTENTFKARFTQHKSSFKLAHDRKRTTLSEHIWDLKDRNVEYSITWDILKHLSPIRPTDTICQLCLQEKLSIIRENPSLNKRNEMFGRCPHRKKA